MLVVDEVFITSLCIVLLLQLNRTPLECAVWSNHSNIVYYFINELKMDVTQFDQVIVTVIFCTICVW